MLYKPRFKSQYHVRVVEPDIVYLLSEQGHCALTGRLYVLLASLLDGSHTTNEIVHQLLEEVSLFEIHDALTSLESQGYLAEASETLPKQVEAFWSSLGVEPQIAVSKLLDSRVSVTGFGKVGVEGFINALKSLSIQVGEGGNFTVVLTDDYLQVGLDAFNREAEETGFPWLLVKPTGAMIGIGPLFVPRLTSCWECLRQRLLKERALKNGFGQQAMILPFLTDHGVIPTSFQVGLNLAAMETAKWIIWGEHQQLTNKIISFDLASLSIQHHVLVKRPQCPVCANEGVE